MIVVSPGDARRTIAPKIDTSLPDGALHVAVLHEYGLPWVTLEYDGKSEELDHEEALAWFKKRGARDMDRVNEAINQALNFYQAEVVIENPVKIERLPGEPEV